MSTIKDQISRISRKAGLGDLAAAATQNMWGINFTGLQNPTPLNRDHRGLTFFTRPSCNLSYDNIAVNRILSPIYDGDGLSSRTYGRAIRVLLDPTLAGKGIKSPIIDDKQCFIPILSNNLVSSSGWEDLMADTYSAQPGVYKESWSMIDSTLKRYGNWNSQMTFRNIEGDPITPLIHYWLEYACSVYEGIMVPYPDAIVNNYIDYTTRVYRFHLDYSKQYVTRVACCGAGFPTTVPTNMNYDMNQVLDEDSAQISFNFQMIGMMYQDPKIFHAFNQTVCRFNPNMVDGKRQQVYKEINARDGRGLNIYGRDIAPLFNYRAYPHVDVNTCELTWWADSSDFEKFMDEKISITNVTTAASTQFPFVG